MQSNHLLFVGHGVVSHHEIDLTHLPNVVDVHALATNQTAAQFNREMKLVDDDLLLFGLLKGGKQWLRPGRIEHCRLS